VSSSEPGEFHRLISSNVRELVQTYRIQRQSGPVTDAVADQLVSRAAHLVVDAVTQFTTTAERGKLMPGLVRVMLATFLETLAAEERRQR
jgi:hypothetical protein